MKTTGWMTLAFVWAINCACSHPASAKPNIRIMPYNNAEFAVDQRFDARVEVGVPSGENITAVDVTIGGKKMPANLGDTTWRGLSFSKAGTYQVVVRARSSQGETTASTQFRVYPIGTGNRRIKNVIICLGDGMGIAHRTAGRIVRFGATNGDPDGRLAIETMPGTGFVSTHSLNSVVTDSSPGMTGYVSGLHNDNNEEGVFPDNTKDAFDNPRIEYLSQFLHRKFGTSLGIVTTADVEDATPAGQMIHTQDRGAGTGICNQFFLERERSGLQVLMGGGRRWFLPKGTFGSARDGGYTLDQACAKAWGVGSGTIADTDNLLDKFEQAGYQYAANATELRDKASKADKLIGLFAYGNMNVALDKIAKRRNPSANGVVDDYHAPDQPMLDEMADAALSVLSKNKKGFNLLVEGAHIDKQSHAMDADRVIWDVLEFDRAVARCLEFAKKNPDTLVIVTGDHECSGFSIIGALKGTPEAARSLPSDAKTLDQRDKPARQALVNTYESAGFPRYEFLADGYPKSADIAGKLIIGFGANADRFEDNLLEPLPVIDGSAPKEVADGLKAGTGASKKVHPGNILGRNKSLDGFFIRGQVPGGSAVHTATDVPIYVFGSRTELWLPFVGTYRNVDVFQKILKSMFGG